MKPPPPSPRWEWRLRHVCGGGGGLLPCAAAAAAAPEWQAASSIKQRLAALQEERDGLQLQLAALHHQSSAVTQLPRQQHQQGLRPCAQHEEIAEADFLDFFRANGYWVVPDAVSGRQLERVQAAWLAASAPAREAWEQSRARSDPWVSSDYFDIPRFIEAHPCLMDLLDNPRVLPLIKLATGGDVVVDQIQGRTVPPSPDSYTGWHRDGRTPSAQHPLHSLSIKAFTFPFNVAPEQAPAAVVPGTHRVQMTVDEYRHQRSSGASQAPALAGMPDSIHFPCKAGTCVFYDNRIFHTSLPNTSRRDRCCLITSYKPLGQAGEGTHARGVSGQVLANAERLAKVRLCCCNRF
jgi:hypothetical protein